MERRVGVQERRVELVVQFLALRRGNVYISTYIFISIYLSIYLSRYIYIYIHITFSGGVVRPSSGRCGVVEGRAGFEERRVELVVQLLALS